MEGTKQLITGSFATCRVGMMMPALHVGLWEDERQSVRNKQVTSVPGDGSNDAGPACNDGVMGRGFVLYSLPPILTAFAAHLLYARY